MTSAFNFSPVTIPFVISELVKGAGVGVFPI
jgi:hypothetical protein